MKLAEQSRIIVDSQAGPGASSHETERLRAEWAAQRLLIEELEAELASLRSRTATAQQPENQATINTSILLVVY